MDSTTVLVVIGCGVLVKTLAFVGFVVRRDRRQRRDLTTARTAAETAARTALDAVAGIAATQMPEGRGVDGPARVWRLQWADPGVLLVENAHGEDAAEDVRLVATLTTGSGLSSSLAREERFVGTGACFVAAFEELRPWPSEAADVLLRGGSTASRSDVGCSLTYTVEWRVVGGGDARRRESGAEEAVVPIPDLALVLG